MTELISQDAFTSIFNEDPQYVRDTISLLKREIVGNVWKEPKPVIRDRFQFITGVSTSFGVEFPYDRFSMQDIIDQANDSLRKLNAQAEELGPEIEITDIDAYLESIENDLTLIAKMEDEQQQEKDSRQIDWSGWDD